MKKLTKPFIVVYDENNSIIIKQIDNKETYVGKDDTGMEFDTEDELDKFIADNDLKESEKI